MKPASRLAGIELSLIRQINALATPQSVNLGIGEPNLEPDETLREMARRAASSRWQYSPNAGFLSLRRRIAAGTPLDPEREVCVTAGTEEALFSLFQAWVDQGDEVLVPNPGFVAYATLAKICGGVAASYALEPPSWRVEAGAIAAKITKRTKIIVVNSPSNPLGAVIDEQTLREIAQLADEHDCLVVSDEIYREIWYDTPPPSMFGMGRNVVVANGMSKSHGMTGLRLGWILGRAEILSPTITAHQYATTCASVFSQSLAEQVLTDQHWNASWLDGVRRQFAMQRDTAMRSIERHFEVAIEPPAGAFYAFVPVPSCNTLSLARSLATDAGVLMIPGVAFGDAGEGFLRISFAARPDQIETGVERAGGWLRGAGR